MSVDSNSIVPRLYIDGVEQQGSFFQSGVQSATILPTIGALRTSPGSPQNHFQGQIGPVRFSNSERYTSNFTPSQHFTADANTVALFNMSEGSGRPLDTSGNNVSSHTVGVFGLQIVLR